MKQGIVFFSDKTEQGGFSAEGTNCQICLHPIREKPFLVICMLNSNDMPEFKHVECAQQEAAFDIESLQKG